MLTESKLPGAAPGTIVTDRLSGYREALRARYVTGPLSRGLFEFLSFGIKQAWACLFGGLLLAVILLTHWFYPKAAALPRYDFLVLVAVGIQAAFLLLKLETWEEAKVIIAFHIVGTIMEIFKTHVGSWTYPEANLLRLGGVPLFSGFMYGAVGSYIARVWRIFGFRFSHYPRPWHSYALALAIYVNFFSHHFMADLRWLLFGATALLFLRTRVWFRPDHVWRRMPLLFGFFLVALFIWLAENIGTFAHAWAYPHQASGWQMVQFSKLGSWYLLMIISYVLVASIHTVAPATDLCRQPLVPENP
jgi:uncharacterized membrane protein YoaT (DUF817 family)